jgi:4-hydroxy-tetrahydrodipicolinate synthase
MVPKFVQLIKRMQEQAGVGSARVRAPRLELQGEELATAKAVFEKAKASRAPIRERPISEFAGS